VNGDEKMLERFLRMFRDRNAGIVNEIGAALAAQDLTTARRLAHSLNGGAGTVGLSELQSAAARLETALAAVREGSDDPARRSADFAALTAAWPRAMEVLAAVLEPSAAHETGGPDEPPVCN